MIWNQPLGPSPGLPDPATPAGYAAAVDERTVIRQALRIVCQICPFDTAAYFAVSVQDGVRVARLVDHATVLPNATAEAAVTARVAYIQWMASETDAVGALPLVLREETSVFAEDYPRHSRAHPDWTALGLKGCGLVPVHVDTPGGGRQLAGVLVAAAAGAAEMKWPAGTPSLLERVAEQLGVSLAQARALSELRSSFAFQDKLHAGIHQISEARSVPDAVDALMEHLSAQFGADSAILCVMDDKEREFEVVGSFGWGEWTDLVGPAEDNYWLWSRAHGRPQEGVTVRDIPRAAYRAAFKGRLLAKGVRVATVSPITFAGNPIGCLACFWTTDIPDQLRPAVDQLAVVFSGVYAALVETQRAVDAKVQSLSTLGVALESRDGETYGHTQRVVSLMQEFCEQLGFDTQQQEWAIVGAYLHDIGKITIPDSILLKPGPLTPSERVIIESHTVQGYNLARRLSFVEKPSLDIILSHHERWDGRGYPNKLSGTSIPLMARMFALIDVYDALTHRRPYKQAWSAAEALQYLSSMAGTQFDPELTKIFLDLVRHRYHRHGR
ncbi:MAG: HD domain-containing protein [Alicyclobacillaceae bacterium]|nr:HD domain-containing protein [Alicyclobacillaceae bacterium]